MTRFPTGEPLEEKKYLLDNIPADMEDIISAAKLCGYDGDRDGIYYTSSAAKVLREHGHIVKDR